MKILGIIYDLKLIPEARRTGFLYNLILHHHIAQIVFYFQDSFLSNHWKYLLCHNDITLLIKCYAQWYKSFL